MEVDQTKGIFYVSTLQDNHSYLFYWTCYQEEFLQLGIPTQDVTVLSPDVDVEEIQFLTF